MAQRAMPLIVYVALCLPHLVTSASTAAERRSPSNQAGVRHGLHPLGAKRPCFDVARTEHSDQVVYNGLLPSLACCLASIKSEIRAPGANYTAAAKAMAKELMPEVLGATVAGAALFFLPRQLDIRYDAASLPSNFEFEQPLRLLPPSGVLFRVTLYAIDLGLDAKNVATLVRGGQIAYGVAATLVLLLTVYMQRHFLSILPGGNPFELDVSRWICAPVSFSSISKNCKNHIQAVMICGGITINLWAHLEMVEVCLESFTVGFITTAALVWVPNLTLLNALAGLAALVTSVQKISTSCFAICVCGLWHPDSVKYVSAATVIKQRIRCCSLVLAAVRILCVAAVIGHMSCYVILARVVHPIAVLLIHAVASVINAWTKADAASSCSDLFVVHMMVPTGGISPGGTDCSMFAVERGTPARGTLCAQILTYVLSCTVCLISFPEVWGRAVGRAALHSEFIDVAHSFIFGGIQSIGIGQALFRTVLLITCFASVVVHVFGNVILLLFHPTYCAGGEASEDEAMAQDARFCRDALPDWTQSQLANHPELKAWMEEDVHSDFDMMEPGELE